MKKQNTKKTSKTETEKLPVFDSMKQMAAQTGIPLPFLRWSAKNGCAFVHHGRCDLRALLDWFFPTGMELLESNDTVDWEIEDKKQSALTRRSKRLQLEDTLIDFETATKCIRELVELMDAELVKLGERLTDKIFGKNEVEIHQVMNAEKEYFRQLLLTYAPKGKR